MAIILNGLSVKAHSLIDFSFMKYPWNNPNTFLGAFIGIELMKFEDFMSYEKQTLHEKVMKYSTNTQWKSYENH